ncbi:uncharacterized protein LOC129605005 [Betta splendens]|uniref:Uncharacterized protein LOC129605005 n=1 Tax=Betta splendens TaxID=158456 RepID=A0A9W2Y801_BETSP|nr:uncharacterized protein LOC129605005 [Betta splendens]XP_055369996.1 uncharacterized protein LOC129605005 [Betta splendens]XP_055369997.1 uncharacterized protein LOC129605005 [Betta splendens]
MNTIEVTLDQSKRGQLFEEAAALILREPALHEALQLPGLQPAATPVPALQSGSSPVKPFLFLSAPRRTPFLFLPQFQEEVAPAPALVPVDLQEKVVAAPALVPVDLQEEVIPAPALVPVGLQEAIVPASVPVGLQEEVPGFGNTSQGTAPGAPGGPVETTSSFIPVSPDWFRAARSLGFPWTQEPAETRSSLLFVVRLRLPLNLVARHGSRPQMQLLVARHGSRPQMQLLVDRHGSRPQMQLLGVRSRPQMQLLVVRSHPQMQLPVVWHRPRLHRFLVARHRPRLHRFLVARHRPCLHRFLVARHRPRLVVLSGPRLPRLLLVQRQLRPSRLRVWFRLHAGPRLWSWYQRHVRLGLVFRPGGLALSASCRLGGAPSFSAIRLGSAVVTAAPLGIVPSRLPFQPSGCWVGRISCYRPPREGVSESGGVPGNVYVWTHDGPLF